MKITVDARGLSCPQPVVLTKKALEDSGTEEIITIVDNKIALENVTKYINSLNLTSEINEKSGEYYINILKEEFSATTDMDEISNTVILITSNVFGKGDDELGNILMKSYMYSLSQIANEIKCIIFMNSGVLLTTEGSDLIKNIEIMEDQGVEIISCGTCLDFYKLQDKLMVGNIGNMYTISEKMITAGKVITI
ncbi:Hypothetical protein SYNTR_0133 [Candidatus Syntrophocurvum alkaliphilum]|uniref:UPF0033 domain-containing protein n=1 Tax=Candidatus Syntrophocurvum alkaliphilum TaxID=2293317 RepID=A0A6I6D5T7_9FIRM|nr:sulfurtransferase-like selenium metabolism protein YedF [Candidatus Syntrophocurvum alkaliphilum]QGT98726.1 Hypothetical protein SYNTR_0133 [Candidatus Syntrophocurvum alkaliphilum]